MDHKNLKNKKKVVDKARNECYYNEVACETVGQHKRNSKT